MHGNSSVVEHDITDTVDLRFGSEGYEIFRVRAAVSYVGCEKAGDKYFLVYGEYILFLILKGVDRNHDYSIKAIRCPFIKSVPASGKLSAFINSPRLQVSLSGNPECTVEDMKPVNKNAVYRITLTCRIEFREPGKNRNDAIPEKPAVMESTGTDSPDSGTVRVWRVDSSKKHTIEQLLSMDRDALEQLGKSHDQEHD